MPTIPTEFVTSRKKERYYIDISTRGLTDPFSGVSGTADRFTASIQNLVVDGSKHYTVEIDSFTYKNVDLGAAGIQIYPILLSDIGTNIRVQNTNSSIIFKSNIPSTSTAVITRDDTNNQRLILDFNKQDLSQISFEIVRSDNGQQYPLDPTSSVQLTLLIQSQD